jgi:hypothetical protein
VEVARSGHRVTRKWTQLGLSIAQATAHSRTFSPYCGCAVTHWRVRNDTWFVFRQPGHRPELEHVAVDNSSNRFSSEQRRSVHFVTVKTEKRLFSDCPWRVQTQRGVFLVTLRGCYTSQHSQKKQMLLRCWNRFFPRTLLLLLWGPSRSRKIPNVV